MANETLWTGMLHFLENPKRKALNSVYSFARSFPGLQGQKDIGLCVILLSRDNERPRTAEPLRQFPSAHSMRKSAQKME